MSFQERLAIIVEANAGKAIAEFKKVGAAAKQAGVSAEGGAKGMARFGLVGQTATNLLKGGIAAAAAGAGAAIAKFAVDGVNAFVEVTGEIRKFQRVSGATAEDASKLVAMFHVLGIDADNAGTAVFRMAVNIGLGKKAFAESGVEIARTKTGAVDLAGTILNVGDAYKKLSGDASKQNALLANVFGARAGQALLPMLGKTREQLEAIFAAAERHGLIFSQEQLDKARDFTIATRELGEAWKGVEVAVGEKIVPILTDLAIAITKVTDAAHGAGSEGKGGKGVKDLANNLLLLSVGAGPPLAAAAKLLHMFAGGEGEAARALAEATTQMQEQTDSMDALKKTIFAAVDAQDAYDAAKRSAKAADRDLAKARAELNKLSKEGAVDEAKVADARRSLADATRSLGHAQREQSKSQGEYNDALAAFNALPTDTNADKLTDARNNLADANDSVASSLEAQANAAADLAKAKAGDPDYQQKLADANQHVADAITAVELASKTLAKRSYENEAANDAEAVSLASKSAEVLNLKTQIEDLLKLHPEQSPYLLPLLTALGGAINANVPGISLGGGGLLPGLTGPGGLLPAFGTSSSTSATTNNVTINATTSEADARLIAKEVMWNLN